MNLILINISYLGLVHYSLDPGHNLLDGYDLDLVMMVITIMMVIMVMIVRSWPRELCFDIDTKLLLNPDHIKMFMITKRANLTQMMIVMKVMIITAGSRKLRLSLCHRLQRQERVAAAPTCSGDHHYCVCVCTFAKSKFACVCACSSNCLLNLNTQKHIHARPQTQNYITQLHV